MSVGLLLLIRKSDMALVFMRDLVNYLTNLIQPTLAGPTLSNSAVNVYRSAPTFLSKHLAKLKYWRGRRIL